MSRSFVAYITVKLYRLRAPQTLTRDGENSHLAVPPNFVLREQVRQQH